MLVSQIYDFLDDLSPFSSQEKWDNCGLIVGNQNDEINQIYISLDLDLQNIQNIKPNSLVITHHPLIFSAIKQINYDDYSSKILKYLIKNDISLISMHTNIDKSHLNRYVFEDILGFEVNIEDKDDFVLSTKIQMNYDDLKQLVAKKLNLNYIKSVDCHTFIENLSMTTGSGMSLIQKIQTDCFLTGDIKFHDAMDAKARNISLIDIGHYESEIHFCALLFNIIQKHLKNNEIKAIILDLNNPFTHTKV
jgi:dinuclear metal center YbgI/SA1388 family protein